MHLDPAFYKQILDHIHDGVYFVDTDRKILYWNAGAERITGYSAEEVIGSRCSDNILVHVDGKGTELCHDFCPLMMAMGDSMEHQSDVYLHHKNGHRVPVSMQVRSLQNDEGQVIGCIETFRQIMNGHDLHYVEELEKASLLDPLTQLANRRYIEMKLSSALEEFRRYEVPFGIIFADIDHFKDINDRHGHLMGDDVLKMIARALSSNVRTTDLVGRWGGEEFLIIASHVTLQNLSTLAEKLRTMIEKSFLNMQGMLVQTTMTFGGTMVRHGDTDVTLIQRADSLMYRGKESGRNRIEIEP